MTYPNQISLWRQIEIYDIQIVLAVAELGSFRKAAGILRLGQSAVSRRVQKLEDNIGVSIFERNSMGVRLTISGRGFVKRAKSLILDFDEAINTACNAGVAGEGELKLGVIASLSAGVLRSVLMDFVNQHPDVNLRVIESERVELLTLLSHRRLDAVVASGGFTNDHGDSIVLSLEPIHVALPTKHHLSNKSRLSWDQVRHEHFIVSTNEPGPEISDYLVQKLARLGQSPRITRHRVGREGAMNLVGLELGISLVADHWRGVKYPGVRFVPIGDDELVPFSLVWRPENDNPALRRFVSLARVHARKAAAGGAASQTPDPSP